MADLFHAARAVSALITGPCWPVPRHVKANAAGIGAQIAKAIQRMQSVQSQCARHKRGLGPTAADEHRFAHTRKTLTLLQTYFVDNVTTSGKTLEAARLALGFGTGLVLADAAPRRVQIQATRSSDRPDTSETSDSFEAFSRNFFALRPFSLYSTRTHAAPEGAKGLVSLRKTVKMY